MPTLQLTAQHIGTSLPVLLPTGRTLTVQPVQLRCLVRLPNFTLPLDAIIDTGAPLVYFPQVIWTRLREGIDFEWLPFAAGVSPPVNRIASWHFTFRFARFLAPIGLMDYTTEVARADVIAAFASGDPPKPRQSFPPLVFGLYGGLLEDGTIAVSRDAGGLVRGELAFA